MGNWNVSGHETSPAQRYDKLQLVASNDCRQSGAIDAAKRERIKSFAKQLIEDAEAGLISAVLAVMKGDNGEYQIAEIGCSLHEKELGDAVYDLAFDAKALRSFERRGA